MSLFGTLILVVVSSALTYFVARSGPSASNPVPLSPEVRKYLSERMGPAAAGAGEDSQKLAARVAQMEAKLDEMEKIRAQYEAVAVKSQEVDEMLAEQGKKREEMLASARARELALLRNEIATICAGVTIKKVKGAVSREERAGAVEAPSRASAPPGKIPGSPGGF